LKKCSNNFRDRNALWANFQASVASSKITPAKAEEKKMVKIEKKYLFAGEYITYVCYNFFVAG
jgi:hypothetical protein